MRRRLIIVSNRAPLGYERAADGELMRKRGAGGLVAALGPLVDLHDVTWIASAMGDTERELAEHEARLEDRNGSVFRLRLVAHDPAAYRSYYDVVANTVLWFVQHGLPPSRRWLPADVSAAWQGYLQVNEAFADAVEQELEREPADAVLFQDYHLYVAPGLVRARRPQVRLAHFVHIPWVPPSAWKALPPGIARAVHEGLLANDSIGFHTERWRSAFVASCAALVGRGDEAEAHSHANPIAVDCGKFERLADDPLVRERERELLESRPAQLVLRVDRTDPAKNAVAGFQALGLLLGRRPDLCGRLGMVALLDPSRQQIPEYAAYRETLENTAAAVNLAFARPGWAPIELRVRDDFPSSVAAYKQYDVLLVNPVMDGLNLVAKEAPLLNVRDGVLVLSRNAGAWEELGEYAIGVDPEDVEQTSRALEQALELSRHERALRLAGLRRRIASHDLISWASAELEALDARSTMRA